MDAVKEAAADTSFTPKDLAMAYAVMLYRVQTRYPDAEIYCLTNVERSDVDEATRHLCPETEPTYRWSQPVSEAHFLFLKFSFALKLVTANVSR